MSRRHQFPFPTRISPLLLLLLLLLGHTLSSGTLRAGIEYSVGVESLVGRTSTGGSLAGMQVRVGKFATGFNPSSANYSEWLGRFIPLLPAQPLQMDTQAFVTAATPLTGPWRMPNRTRRINAGQDPVGFAEGDRLFLWISNATTVGPVTEIALLTHSSWTYRMAPEAPDPGKWLTLYAEAPDLLAGTSFNGRFTDSAGESGLSLVTAALLTGPEMTLRHGTSDLVSGESAIDFGNVTVGAGATLDFTVRNIGTAELSLSGNPRVTVSGSHAADFAVITQPAATVEAGGVTAFTVRFMPRAAGARTARLSLASNDSDENPFHFDIRGIGVPPSAGVPVIAVFDSGETSLTAGRALVDFGLLDLGESFSRTFRVSNSGVDSLSGLSVSFQGGHPEFFSLLNGPPPTVPPSSTAAFEVRLRTDTPGAHSTTMRIFSNDTARSPFNITLRFQVGGTETIGAGIDILRPGDTIAGTSPNFPAAEAPRYAIDNSAATKYLNFDKEGSGFEAVIPLARAAPVRSLSFISANDTPGRDPASYEFYGSHDGAEYQKITQGALQFPQERFSLVSRRTDSETAYRYYRLVFPSLADTTAPFVNSMQIAEVQFLQYPDILPGALITGLVTPQNPDEGVDKLNDGLLETKMGIGGSQIQVLTIRPAASYGNHVVKGMNLITGMDNSLYAGRHPTFVHLDGSRDGATYEPIYEPAAHHGQINRNLVIDEYVFPHNQTAYSAYRLTLGSGASGFAQISEIQLFGAPNASTSGFQGWIDGYGLTDVASSGDPDGDGFTNRQEYEAGTDPRLSDDYLRVGGITQSNGKVTLSWASTAGRQYHVERSADLKNWTVVARGIAAAPPVNTFTENAPVAGRVFYRLQLLKWGE